MKSFLVFGALGIALILGLLMYAWSIKQVSAATEAPGTNPFNGRIVDPDTQPQGLPMKLPMLMVPTDGEPVFFACIPLHKK